jgi:hypothetical protein
MQSFRTLYYAGRGLLVLAGEALRDLMRSPRARVLAGGGVIVIMSFAAALWAIDALFPGGNTAAPKLAELPPLQPATRTSVVIAPTAVALAAIRNAMDNAAPRTLTDNNKNPVTSVLSKADIGLTVTRGPMAIAGRPEGLTVTTPINGSLRITGQIATQAGNLTGALTGAFSDALGKQVQTLTGRVLDQRADVHGQVAVTSRPTLTPAWRLAPNLTGQVTIGDSAVSLAGVKINVANEVKPIVDKQVSEQIGALENRLRNDPMLENTARREWAKMCRSIPLGGAQSGLPDLWLELKPVRAAAAQPKIDGSAVTITIGVQAETRILPSKTDPSCPFPARLEIVPALDQGRLSVGVPIDVPFTAINTMLEAQLKGHSFPEDGSGSVDVKVLRATVGASGDRLLISLRVKAVEKKSWFGFGAEATVHIWGKPALDQQQQILRLTGTSLAVESEAAFGLLGAAARAAMPYLQDALAQNAVIDLKPFTANARDKIGAALNDFRAQGEGVRVDAAVNDLRLTGIEFDSKTLRVFAESNGTLKVAVSQLPGM